MYVREDSFQKSKFLSIFFEKYDLGVAPCSSFVGERELLFDDCCDYTGPGLRL